ncbi:MAG: choice-of-anchor J domain-containing protein [Flavobacterium sp.]|nr:choice-of-anchor J domain-containing protein [Flavobacterium sp.]
MKNIVKLSVILVLMISFSGCVSEYYKAPDLKTAALSDCKNPGLLANKTVADIWAIAVNPTVPAGSTIPSTPIYSADDIIEGYVISSDEGGNFYKSMFFQPLDKSRGFNLSTDLSYAYINDYLVGRKVYVKMKGLAYCNPTSYAAGLTFGGKPTDKYNVDRLSIYETKKAFVPSCDFISEDALVNSGLTISQVKNDIYLNTLVELKNTQFKSDCTTYSGKDFDTSLKLTDASGATLDLRTSRYSNFAGKYVSSGNGTIRGILSKYGSGYQIAIRTERDVKFNNPRIGTAVSPPKIGATSTTFNSTLNENFTSYSNTAAANIPAYINQVDIGTKYWDIASFGTPTNRYIQTSAFNNGCTKNYFVVPVNLATAKTLSFKTADGYNNGLPLKVYYSTNYTPGTNMNQATLIDISSKFIFADGRPATSSGYASSFTPSGTYNIPGELSGNGYFIFEYDGTTGVTTTYQLDDIVIN